MWIPGTGVVIVAGKVSQGSISDATETLCAVKTLPGIAADGAVGAEARSAILWHFLLIKNRLERGSEFL